MLRVCGSSLLLVLALGRMAAQDPEYPERQVSLNVKSFASNFFSDQAKIWSFPVKLATGHALIPTLAVAAATAATVPLDPTEARYFRRNADSYDRLNRIFSENHTTYATLLTPAAFYAAGLIKRDSYLKRTGLL